MKHVALPQDLQAAVETRPVVAVAGGEVVVEVDRVVDARRPQGVALQVQRLVAVALRDAGVAGRGRPCSPCRNARRTCWPGELPDHEVADRLREEAAEVTGARAQRNLGPQVRRGLPAYANHPAGHDDDRVAHAPDRKFRPTRRLAEAGLTSAIGGPSPRRPSSPSASRTKNAED